LVMAWDVTGRRTGAGLRPSPDDDGALEALCARLADDNAAVAYDAVWALAATPTKATQFLRQRMRVTSDAVRKQIGQLIADLDDDEFTVRQSATAKLEGLGLAAEASLRRCLARKPSPEVRWRAEDLLRKLEQRGPNEDAALRDD